MNDNSPVVKHLVLIGGGHSHLSILKHLGMKPVPGLAVTLISRDIVTPYSGSMPAFIAGHTSFDDMHIDLRPLAQFAGVRLIQAEMTQLNLESKVVHLKDRPDIPFDLISLNIGSKPNGSLIQGADKYATAIKPINHFLQCWDEIYNEALAAVKANESYTLAIIGGGPASVELALAAHYKIHRESGYTVEQKSSIKIAIVTHSPFALNAHNEKAKAAVAEELSKRNIEVIANTLVSEIKAGAICAQDGSSIAADRIVFATGASIPHWPKEAGLALSADGFIEVNQHLQSTSHPFVFAAGDAATIKGHQRPKSGVYAVRQGKPLTQNLLRYASNRPLKKYRPQKNALALVNLGNKSALAIRGNVFWQSRAVWSLKQRIDNAFVRKYTQLPQMKLTLNISPGLVDKKTERELNEHAMRCAGCGAKVAGSLLDEVLPTVPRIKKSDVIESRSRVEDASQIDLGNGRQLLQSIDQIKAFTNDPWLFARIATNHCLSDIYAMGADPHSALALVSLPHATKRYMRSQLLEIMQGCALALQENDCALIGGHSSESAEMQFGLSINGFSNGDLLSKDGFELGDVLILTKPLGSGTLLAADMRSKAKQTWMDSLLNSMLMSNRSASEAFRAHKASACTDITGFGLAGHLLEMLESQSATAALKLNAIPIFHGAVDCLASGIKSSLHNENARAEDRVHLAAGLDSQLECQLLYDPQTSGGLLATMNPENVKNCLEDLRKSGLMQAQVIGEISALNGDGPAISLA